MEIASFPHSQYYSQTEVVRKYRVSVKAFKQLLVDRNIQVVSREADLGDLKVKTVYVRKEDINKLKLEKR
jgi:hypothetical protein